ncbi:hypothetical protein EJB05_15869, partial [Eragrostis curvula]
MEMNGSTPPQKKSPENKETGETRRSILDRSLAPWTLGYGFSSLGRCSVAQALPSHGWFHGILMAGRLLRDIILTEEEDQHTWHFDASGIYSAESAYRAFFNGSVTFEPWRRLWKSWAPGKSGLSHQEKCPLCDEEGETVQHLLVNCVVWFSILSPLGLERVVPKRREKSFADWWSRAICKVKKEDRKGVNSLIILTAWLLWKRRIACMFDGASTSVPEILRQFRDEYKLWCMAGARKLQALRLDGVGVSG